MVGEFQNKSSSLFDLAELRKRGGFLAGDLLAVEPNLFEKFMQHISRTVKRDQVVKTMVFLTGLSAFTKEPINLFLRGESSTGKTYNATQVLRYFPQGDVWKLGGLSPTALVHSRGVLVDKNGDPILPNEKPGKDASEQEKEAWRERLKESKYLVDLQGKILVFLEAPNSETYNMLRPILSHDAWEISYKFTDKSGKGQLKTQHVVIRGWPATIFCTSKEKYIHDLATRGFTLTPETSEEKIRDALELAGEKAAFPWLFEDDFDFMLLRGYLGWLKNKLPELNVVVPYAKKLAKHFPAKFPRLMRDLPHLLSLIKVYALFHYAQRPVLIRGDGDNEEIYVLAVLEDFEKIWSLWQEIKETTVTGTPAHVLDFYKKVFDSSEPLTIEEITDKYNQKSLRKKSKKTIYRWIQFLYDVGWLTEEPDPNDKRRKLVKPTGTANNENILKLSQIEKENIFSLETLKEWLNELKKLFSQNHFLLKKNLLAEKAENIEEIHREYFLCKRDIRENNFTNEKREDSTETNSEIFSFQKREEMRTISKFKPEDVRELVRLSSNVQDKCVVCGFKGRMDWQVTLHDGSWGLLCEECGFKLSEAIRR